MTLKPNVSDLVIVTLADDDHGKAYALHPECLAALREIPGVGRVVEIAPAALGTSCDFGTCEVTR